MTLDQGQTETNDIQDIDDVEGHKRAAPLTDDGNDDVEGHRIASFVEDYKDDALGLRRSPDDLQGRRPPFVDEAEEDVEGHSRVPFADEDADDDAAGQRIHP